MAGRPPHDDAGAPLATREVPERVRPSRAAVDRTQLARDRIEDHPVHHPVSIGSLAGRERGPRDRRIRQYPGDQAPRGPGGNQPAQRRQQPGLDCRLRQIVTQAVEANEQEPLVLGRHGRAWIRLGPPRALPRPPDAQACGAEGEERR
jgi:hypothetical protein